MTTLYSDPRGRIPIEEDLPSFRNSYSVACLHFRTFVLSSQGNLLKLTFLHTYVNRLKEERIFQSMSRKGSCLDNNVMENFFGLLQHEMYYGQTYHSFEELERAICRYIEYYRRIVKSTKH